MKTWGFAQTLTSKLNFKKIDLISFCRVQFIQSRLFGLHFFFFFCVFQEVNFQRQFCIRKICSCTLNFLDTNFCGICSLFISKMRNLCSWLLFHKNLPINRLLTSDFVLDNGKTFNRSNGLVTERFTAC